MEIHRDLNLVIIIGFYQENNYDLKFIPIPNDKYKKIIFDDLKDILNNKKNLNIGLLFNNSEDKCEIKYIGKDKSYIELEIKKRYHKEADVFLMNLIKNILEIK